MLQSIFELATKHASGSRPTP